MTTTDPTPFMSREWRSTTDIARDAWDAEGRRGDFRYARNRVWLALIRMEKTGRAERMESGGEGPRFRPNLWRLVRWPRGRKCWRRAPTGGP